jgi:hypothetical protein
MTSMIKSALRVTPVSISTEKIEIKLEKEELIQSGVVMIFPTGLGAEETEGWIDIGKKIPKGLRVKCPWFYDLGDLFWECDDYATWMIKL